MLVYQGVVAEESRVGEARRTAQATCAAIGFGEELTAKAALIVTELGTNLLKHTGGKGGELLLQKSELAGETSLDVWALDKGPGIANIGVALRDGFSTSGTYGAGLGGIRSMAQHFDLYSEPGKGTAVFARISASPARTEGWEIGAIEVPIKGETVCGDGWDAAFREGALTILLSDGLGHGPAAHEASVEARRYFRQNVYTRPTNQVLQEIHANLRATRGAAVALARWDGKAITYCGIGNISGVVLGGPRNQQMISMNGITGHEARRVQTFNYETGPGTFVVMHSDGLQSRWDLAEYRGLALKHPALIAGVLYRDFSRGRDDTTVVVARRT